METLPKHLRKYIVEQTYEKYTPIDQAVWRFILRQLKNYLATHAHDSYLEGLDKTGIEIEEIPRIENISKKLQAYGWRAYPVSGFIPPAAFMELQSLGVLPIASDLRTLDHLLYTPAPDIVHEAAGHAPILIHPEFSSYLKKYSIVAKKAIISKEDMALYEAIRILSDLKENPESTQNEIQAAEKNLDQTVKNISHTSEASILSRMNWWTAEYGLIGDLNNPKIYGAGLLSSVGESKWCLSDKVKKLPLTIDCIKYSYDITEPQPQLFVTPDFKTLSLVLEEMASQMAFRKGGLESLEKAQKAKCITTTVLNSGLQISGVLTDIFKTASNEIVYLKTSGPSQLSFQDKELPGHGVTYHSHGFGFPIGNFKKFSNQCPSQLSPRQFEELNIKNNLKTEIEYTSGLKVSGVVQSVLRKNDKNLLVSLIDATVTYEGHTLFDPSWGTFDLALGSSIPSVFGGPADRSSYGETDDFVAARVPIRSYSEDEKKLHQLYSQLRNLRKNTIKISDLNFQLSDIFNKITRDFNSEWLLLVEILELLYFKSPQSELIKDVMLALEKIKKISSQKASLIDDGIKLAEKRF